MKLLLILSFASVAFFQEGILESHRWKPHYEFFKEYYDDYYDEESGSGDLDYYDDFGDFEEYSGRDEYEDYGDDEEESGDYYDYETKYYFIPYCHKHKEEYWP